MMIGGFLGAGKTTAVSWLARRLRTRGLRVGLITNDQGENLADTALLRSLGFATEEIPGGCFCCRFNSLLDASNRLMENIRPDVFIAEPVGSCTDLIATVIYPLRRLYGNDFSIAPVSVLVDPIRAMRVFGLETGGTFSEKVLYIYKKQLEEADLVVISKCDLVNSEQIESLQRVLAKEFPQKEILAVSARTGHNLEAWFDKVGSQEPQASKAMNVDYQIYADGEALLGWLNCTVQLSSKSGFIADEVLKQLADEIHGRLKAKQAEVAHLKITLSPDSALGELAAINLVRNDFVPEITMHLKEPMQSGRVILNLRCETEPEVLASTVCESVAAITSRSSGLEGRLEHLQRFRPGKPMPTHRFESV
jgi:Ni2+-binding GTPase involved in maturation of urease and hydrogenase